MMDTEKGMMRLTFPIEKHNTFSDLYINIKKEHGIHVGDDKNLGLFFKDSQVVVYESVSSIMMKEGDTLDIRPKLSGGGLFRQTRKTFVKKCDAVDDLERAMKESIIKTKVPKGDDFINEFKQVIATYKGMINEAKMLKANGCQIFQMAVRRMSYSWCRRCLRIRLARKALLKRKSCGFHRWSIHRWSHWRGLPKPWLVSVKR